MSAEHHDYGKEDHHDGETYDNHQETNYNDDSCEDYDDMESYYNYDLPYNVDNYITQTNNLNGGEVDEHISFTVDDRTIRNQYIGAGRTDHNHFKHSPLANVYDCPDEFDGKDNGTTSERVYAHIIHHARQWFAEQLDEQTSQDR